MESKGRPGTDYIPNLNQAWADKEAQLNDESFIEWAPEWLEKEDQPDQEVIEEYLVLEALAVVGGRPRAMKSLFLREIAIACATQTPAFGIPELTPKAKFKVLICAQEDKAYKERARIKALLKGRGINEWPDNLALAIHKRISLDDPIWVERLKRAIIKHNFQIVIIDPARRFTKKADKGPSDVSDVTNALRYEIIVPGH
ncbi:helicase RepA family protein, partial [bacterium]|nr:helicase RepA family protein [bacterium]